MRIYRAASIVLIGAGLLGGSTACGAAPSGPTASVPASSESARSSPTLPASSPSVPASSVAMASGSASPTAFTGHIVCGPPNRDETSTQVGDHEELRGGAWTPTATDMSDPRLAGTYTISSDADGYRAPGSGKYTLGSETWRIETGEGAWEGSFLYVGFPDGYVSTVTTVLVGEGGYDGLSAIWEADYLGDATCAWDIRGVIFPAAPPAPPTAP